MITAPTANPLTPAIIVFANSSMPAGNRIFLSRRVRAPVVSIYAFGLMEKAPYRADKKK
jgi:hypothetical protein